ncbi:hypothetical protein P171DRAFT_44463 [Karstenula rhodostoma CBS 690.94]|uniref:Uncharacterized protein n=1 Tax=Karstenula rhodostoma CBS 690.94 TaxID=1392251 RepID=A0A9P4UC68_9PLEO|nr:hypothetical protein P171DRAFT_44463 [Karstenula rhodostoma CBS 690.94]
MWFMNILRTIWGDKDEADKPLQERYDDLLRSHKDTLTKYVRLLTERNARYAAESESKAAPSLSTKQADSKSKSASATDKNGVENKRLQKELEDQRRQNEHLRMQLQANQEAEESGVNIQAHENQRLETTVKNLQARLADYTKRDITHVELIKQMLRSSEERQRQLQATSDQGLAAEEKKTADQLAEARYQLASVKADVDKQKSKLTNLEADIVHLEAYQPVLVGKKNLNSAEEMKVQSARKQGYQDAVRDYREKSHSLEQKRQKLDNEVKLFESDPVKVLKSCMTHFFVNSNPSGASEDDLEAAAHDGFCHGYAEAYKVRDEIRCMVFDPDDIDNPVHPFNRAVMVARHAVPILLSQKKFPYTDYWDTRKFKSEWTDNEILMPRIPAPSHEYNYWFGIRKVMTELDYFSDMAPDDGPSK